MQGTYTGETLASCFIEVGEGRTNEGTDPVEIFDPCRRATRVLRDWGTGLGDLRKSGLRRAGRETGAGGKKEALLTLKAPRKELRFGTL